jgi:O-antigen ligase
LLKNNSKTNTLNIILFSVLVLLSSMDRYHVGGIGMYKIILAPVMVLMVLTCSCDYKKVFFGNMHKVVVFFILINIVSILFNINTVYSLDNLFSLLIISIVSFFMGELLIKNWSHHGSEIVFYKSALIIFCLLVFGILVDYYSIIEIPSFTQKNNATSNLGFFGGENGSNYFIVFLSPFIFYGVTDKKRMFNIALFFIGFYALFLTGNRGAIIAYLMVFIYITIIGGARLKSMLSIFFILLFFSVEIIETTQRIYNMYNIALNNIPIELDGSINERVSSALKALDYIRKNPFIGVGFGQYSELESLPIHNVFLRIFVESGMIGFMAFILLFYKIFKNSLFFFRQRKVYFWLAVHISIIPIFLLYLMEPGLQRKIFWIFTLPMAIFIEYQNSIKYKQENYEH